MPEGFYGTVTIEGKMYIIRYWSPLKKNCKTRAKFYRDSGEFVARVIKHDILKGTEKKLEWAVAIRKKVRV